MDGVDRRFALSLLAAAAASPWIAGEALAAAPAFTMWRDPGCGCCLEWAKRMEAAFGRPLATIEASDMQAVKRLRGVPADLQSCHTALVGAFTIEGHVPPADVRRLLARPTAGIRGLAVPGMPMGSPGMDHGGHRDPYRVIAFGPRGRSVFASYG